MRHRKLESKLNLNNELHNNYRYVVQSDHRALAAMVVHHTYGVDVAVKFKDLDDPATTYWERRVFENAARAHSFLGEIILDSPGLDLVVQRYPDRHRGNLDGWDLVQAGLASSPDIPFQHI